jgi:hypothetical protein
MEQTTPPEPHFHIELRGSDQFAPSLIELWAALRYGESKRGIDALQDASEAAATFRHWLYLNRKREKRFIRLLPFEVLAEELRRRGAVVTFAASTDPISVDHPMVVPSIQGEVNAGSEAAKAINGHLHHDFVDGPPGTKADGLAGTETKSNGDNPEGSP